MKTSKSLKFRRSPGQPEAQGSLRHRYGPSGQWGETEAGGAAGFPNRTKPKTLKSRHKPALQRDQREGQIRKTQKTGTHPNRGNRFGQGLSRAAQPAHALSPLRRSSPSPQSRLPSELGPSRELSGAPLARPCGIRRRLGSPQGPSKIPLGLVGRRVGGGGGETRPYPTRRLLLRRPPLAVPEAPPPGPPKPPFPRPPSPLLT